MALPSWFYITFWIAVSCSMIMFNKGVLDKYDFPYPMFLTCWHMFFATILTQIMAKTTNMLPAVNDKRVDQKDIINNIMPVALLFSISLVLCNKAYIYLSVSYIQMLKAFTPVAVLIFSYISGIDKITVMEFLIVTLISIGVAIASVGESYFSMIGFLFQSLGILAESSRLVMTSILMKSLKLDPLSSLYYIAPICFCFISVACFFFEFETLPVDRILSQEFFPILLANAIVAFTLNVAVVLLIGNTSALVLTLAGVIKDVLLIVLSMVVFKSPVTPTQYFGYSLALVGLNVHKEYKKSPELVSAVIQKYVFCNAVQFAETPKSVSG